MSQIILYQSEDGRTKLDVQLEGQTLWLNQKQLTELYGKAKGTISEHIKHIFEDGELEQGATVRPFRTVQIEGRREVTRDVEHYNLDMVIALGFRVRSPMAVRFRLWAADKLKEYIVKGFVLDDARLKNPQAANDYFEELARRIQDIRTSERRFYQKITDIYATSVDYDNTHPLTQTFFATVQNKIHYAIHGQTAAEVIISRADGNQADMGLTNWEGARIRKSDVAIAKNYLDEDELREQPRRAIPHFRPIPSRAPHFHDDEGLDNEVGGISQSERPGDTQSRRKSLCRASEISCRARVHRVSESRRSHPGI